MLYGSMVESDDGLPESDKGGVGTPASPKAALTSKSSPLNSSWLNSSSASSSCTGAKSSRRGIGGLVKGREFVSFSNSSRHIALKDSNSTTTRHLVFSPPLLLAIISHKSSVYCAIFSKVAILEYKDEEDVQNVV
eukprot:TRINITY_DN1497_c0_g1_i1.p3 TRINITY_DN1497_c0_g1~~TRINITY_DN1497_c0_g1_i1.p3  ORF type:complete len:135 (+),score=12.65 TRINITY_DN1497_c0_g1_i1:747-1151(+)